MTKKEIKQIKERILRVCSNIRSLKDSEFKELVNTKIFNELLLSIINPSDSKKESNLQEFFLKNKNKLSFLALLRYAIGENYSFAGNVNGHPVYVSPFYYQWLANGVIFTQGKEKFAGMIGFYDNDRELYFARSKRNFNSGDKIDLKKDLFFDFFYQKIEKMNEINLEDKKEIIEGIEKIEKEKEQPKKDILISKFGKWLDNKTDRLWYQTVKAFFDSILKKE